VIIDALVGVQVGLTQKLLKVNPLLRSVSIFGVLGFTLPSIYPLIASFPKSSAIMSNILGVLMLGTTGFHHLNKRIKPEGGKLLLTAM